MHRVRILSTLCAVTAIGVVALRAGKSPGAHAHTTVTVTPAIAHDVSGPLTASDVVATNDGDSMEPDADRARRPMAVEPNETEHEAESAGLPVITAPPGSAAVEQTTFGTKPPATLVASFDGLGVGFTGPQGTANLRNPSDNTLAVGPNHIVQIVNTRMAIFTKKGARYDTTGLVLYGPGETRNVFKGFGGGCEARNNGDAVVRYDQLADRWLIVMPIFTRLPVRQDAPPAGKDGDSAAQSVRGQPGQPRAAAPLYVPPPAPPESAGAGTQRPQGQRPPPDSGAYAMCYAVSIGTDPFGPYYRYEFVRPLFPDYPRPAVWPDGYYVPTSTGDEVIQKHACVADRASMLQGKDATEQCVIIDGVNFLNNADLDGKQLPPTGAPNIMIAAGGTQLKNAMEDSDFEGAAKVLKKAAKLLEENADAVADLRLLSEAYLQLGVAYFRDGLEDEGDEMLTKAIHLDPDRKLAESDYPPIFIKIYERSKFNVLRRPRAQIEVKAKAGAQVLFDGRNMGKAPIMLKEALPGDHWVRVERPGEAPLVKKIQARGKTTLVVEFEGGGGGAKEDSSPVGVLGAIARNSIAAEHVKQLAGAGRRAGADFVMFGAIFTTDTAYQIRTAYVRVKDGSVGRLLDVAFDLDMLSAEIEVFKLIEDAKKQTSGEFARPITEPTFAIAPDLKAAPAKREVVAGGKPETKMSTAIAAPQPIKPPDSIYASVPPEAPAATTAEEKKPAAAPPPKPKTLPKDEIAATEPKSEGSGVTAATLVIKDEEQPSNGPGNWWIWVLVGVAAAGAVAGTSYGIYASQQGDDATLQVRW